MSPIAAFFLNPKLNLPGAFVAAAAEIWSWFTSVDDPYRVTPFAFMLCVYFIGMLAVREHVEADRLRREAQPRLSLVFKPEQGDPYMVEKPTGGQSTKRIYRVGVINSGKETVHNVGVLLRNFMPTEPEVRLKHEMILMKAPESEDIPYETRTDINPGDQPMKFFQIAMQQFGNDGSYVHPPELDQASQYSVRLKKNAETYKLAVEIDGAHADKPMGFIYRRDTRGIYELTRDMFSKL